MQKFFFDPVAALDGVLFDGMTILSYGVGAAQAPIRLLAGVRRSGVRDLTLVTDNVALGGLERLIDSGQVRRVIAPSVPDGVPPDLARAYRAGDLALELDGQASLDERLMAGRLATPSYLTRTGLGSPAAEGKVLEVVAGATFVREAAIRADLAIVCASRADEQGNLRLHATPQRSPLLVTAARMTVVEVEAMAPEALDASRVHIRGIYVDRIVRDGIRRSDPIHILEGRAAA